MSVVTTSLHQHIRDHDRMCATLRHDKLVSLIADQGFELYGSGLRYAHEINTMDPLNPDDREDIKARVQGMAEELRKAADRLMEAL